MRRSTTVVLADDHTLVRAGIRSVLEHLRGIEVVGEAGDGLETLRLVERHRPDVVLLDITMPGLNGFEVAARVRRMHLGTRVLVLSMYTTPEYVARALSAGAAGYLVKDAAVDELAEALDRVLLGRRFLSRAINAEVVDRVLAANTDPDAELAVLTSRQREILQLIAEGQTNRTIAERLGLSIKTVDGHRTRVMNKLDLHDATALTRFAIRHGLVSPDQ
jgi:DNA-binding NarL/FixJ family response regulator